MMWDFSGSAANGQSSLPYPVHQQRSRGLSPAPPFPSAPSGYGFPSSAPAPAPFMPIGSAVSDTAASYAGTFGSVTRSNDPGPWVVPNGPAPVPREPVSMPRGPGYGSSGYTVHTHYSSHRHHSHSHSHSHSQPARPAVVVHHSSSPAAVVVHQSSKPQKTSSKPHRPHADPVQHLLPMSSSGPGREHTFQYSKCTGKRKALCIGINYAGLPNELHGCVNDARNVERFLLRHGYKPDDIVMLTDDATDPRRRPTKLNILDAMHWLVTGAHPHDSLFFHYSGHGGQVKDKDGDEVDGYDEIIFPLDFKKAGYISDDLMHTIMVKKLPPGCRLTALFDSCHSGSVLDLPYLYSSDGRVKGSQVTKRWFDAKSTPADVITWSGCKDSQTSADTWEAGVATGAMSYAFMASLKQNPSQTYQELLRSVRTILKKNYSQKPQLSSSHRIDTTLKFIF
ncbi:caspase domain-containing protein [Dichomitus squalens]|uniref:Peptidase C14 caspase domain-containing protein n=1 Tax=Dichomitus squalens (strain LYAD-421) TaxID=732165 RepID=R7SZK8_DICSQ|nr:uncharacterized protein DICSQDRAFT_136505 [Dichomitus squalens LYAD-421 SS1]EJF61624.1 hypothetical protein DICSQDRAFT_136505 [Dichomitus squalens LYAD-421 SS1]TBU43169.1 caspase domain-containing protein [Dichomitus squalens]